MTSGKAMHSDHARIAACISACMQHRDGRGWRFRIQELADELAPTSTPTIARMTAVACSRVAAEINAMAGR